LKRGEVKSKERRKKRRGEGNRFPSEGGGNEKVGDGKKKKGPLETPRKKGDPGQNYWGKTCRSSNGLRAGKGREGVPGWARKLGENNLTEKIYGEVEAACRS